MPYSIVTPSYSGDLERCRLLTQSIERMVAGTHYIIVDPADVTLFKPLERHGAVIVDSRPLMSRLFRPLFGTKYWFRPPFGAFGGWMSQQIRKIAFAAEAPTENIMFVDSDVVFVRPFDPERLTVEGRTPLFTIDWFNEESLRWANQSRRLLGLDERPSSHGYVHPTFWRRSVVQRMIAAVEAEQGRDWQEVIARLPTFSEYTLYGIFGEEKVGLDPLGLYSFDQPLMHLSWEYDLRDKAELDRFFDEIAPHHVAMMFHSKWRVPASAYQERITRLLASPPAT